MTIRFLGMDASVLKFNAIINETLQDCIKMIDDTIPFNDCTSFFIYAYMICSETDNKIHVHQRDPLKLYWRKQAISELLHLTNENLRGFLEIKNHRETETMAVIKIKITIYNRRFA